MYIVLNFLNFDLYKKLSSLMYVQAVYEENIFYQVCQIIHKTKASRIKQDIYNGTCYVELYKQCDICVIQKNTIFLIVLPKYITGLQ